MMLSNNRIPTWPVSSSGEYLDYFLKSYLEISILARAFFKLDFAHFFNFEVNDKYNTID